MRVALAQCLLILRASASSTHPLPVAICRPDTPPMTRHADPSALIVGAGPTGLALACDLARRGVPCRIIDKAPQYFAGSRGKGLQPRTLEVLEDLGVIDSVLAGGRFHLPFRAYDGAAVLGDHDMHEGRVPT